jgi:hypothetical protein
MLEQELTTHQRIDVLEVREHFKERLRTIYVMNGKDAYQHDLISTAIIILRLKKEIEKLKEKEEIEEKLK